MLDFLDGVDFSNILNIIVSWFQDNFDISIGGDSESSGMLGMIIEFFSSLFTPAPVV